MLIERVLI